MLLASGLADEELPRLAVVIGKALGAQPALGALLDVRKRHKTALGGFTRAFAERIRLVIHTANRIAHRHVTVLLEVVERALRRIDRDVGEIRAAEPLQLGIEIGE